MSDSFVANTLIEWGVAAKEFSGEDESGDGHLVAPYSGGVLIAVVDGLGHGPIAAAVAKAAIATLEGHPQESVDLLVKRCHQVLRGTRGAVLSVAAFSARDEAMTWVGVGNVTGVLLRADQEAARPSESLLLRGGVVGYHLPSLFPVVLPVSAGDTLIFATDGLRSSFTEGVALDDSPQQIADHLLANYSRGTDDTLALVARYVGRRAG
jgi:negative regulator of sigma-B (phosphoserine phosphatase)